MLRFADELDDEGWWAPNDGLDGVVEGFLVNPPVIFCCCSIVVVVVRFLEGVAKKSAA